MKLSPNNHPTVAPSWEERVHPGIGVRIVRRSRAEDGIAAGVGRHRHDGHPVGVETIHGLQIPVIEGLIAKHEHQGFDDPLIRDLTGGRDPTGGVGVGFPSEVQEQMRDAASEDLVGRRVALFEFGERRHSAIFQRRGACFHPVGLADDRSGASTPRSRW